MHCPNCGAENEADARFCAECGTPLENQDIEATIVSQAIQPDLDSDVTIQARPEELAAEEAQTVQVDQAQVEAALNVDESASPAESEPAPPASDLEENGPDAGDSDGNTGASLPPGSDEGGRNRNMIIAAVVVAGLILICCCCSLAIGGALGSDPAILEDIIRELSQLAVQAPLVS